MESPSEGGLQILLLLVLPVCQRFGVDDAGDASA